MPMLTIYCCDMNQALAWRDFFSAKKSDAEVEILTNVKILSPEYEFRVKLMMQDMEERNDYVNLVEEIASSPNGAWGSAIDGSDSSENVIVKPKRSCNLAEYFSVVTQEFINDSNEKYLALMVIFKAGNKNGTFNMCSDDMLKLVFEFLPGKNYPIESARYNYSPANARIVLMEGGPVVNEREHNPSGSSGSPVSAASVLPRASVLVRTRRNNKNSLSSPIDFCCIQ